MKIALISEGKATTSLVVPLSMRNAGVLIYDVNNLKFAFLNSANGKPLSPGDEMQTARMMIDAGVEVLVVGGISPESLGVLVKAGLRIYECIDRTVLDAIDALKLNLLPAVGNA